MSSDRLLLRRRKITHFSSPALRRLVHLPFPKGRNSMTQQYLQRNINLNVETSFNSFVFNPSAPQTDISFSDWDVMLTVLQGLPGIKEIIIPEAPPTIQIPPGVYDMTNIIISGATPFAVVEANDAQFQ